MSRHSATEERPGGNVDPPGISLLLADTARSQAYAQAILRRRFPVQSARLVRSPRIDRWGQTNSAPASEASSAVTLPDLTVPLLRTVEELTSEISQDDTGSLNTDECAEWLRSSNADLVVFSGFGGEIIKDHVLDAGPPLLHVHSGALPEYRGSTTIYYSILNENSCAVSALILESTIDTGPIVGSREFPPPPAGVDIDYLYDPAMRAELLCDVVDSYLNTGQYPMFTHQPDEGTTYFIIHPVLKHIALGRINHDA